MIDSMAKDCYLATQKSKDLSKDLAEKMKEAKVESLLFCIGTQLFTATLEYSSVIKFTPVEITNKADLKIIISRMQT